MAGQVALIEEERIVTTEKGIKIIKKSKSTQEIVSLDKEISGFNVGVNIGKDAGQSIMHCHLHLIPWRKGDVKDPRGGVRGVIPEKQKYKRK